VGLGNPGAEYARTRHNVGAEVVAILADRHGGRFRKSRQRAEVAEVRIADRRVALALPRTYMNESGLAIGPLVRRFGVRPEQVVVVHDELDLVTATMRLKAGGGLAGHNGLASVRSALGSDTFLRVRIGVDKPPSRERGADHVLRQFSRPEREAIDVTLERAADAVESIVDDGIDAAMNRYN
jgi:peptidyl-tRNA hydrolase, PTH1 family